LFGTNGTLLTTITNPTPAVDDSFGVSVASVGNDRLLIGAYSDDVGTDDAGAAYLFSADGTLLMTITNPTPAASDFFGVSVASVGNDRLLIGASHAGGANSGAVHLFINQTFTPGLVAEGVRAGSISTASLENGAVATAKLADSAVTAAKLDPAIGVWTQSGNNVFRSAGNVGIGTTNPQVPLHIRVTGPVIFLQDAASAANQAGYISYRNNNGTETAWVGFGTPSSPTFSVVNARSGGNIELSPFSGNVGIKRTPAANALEVEGNASKTVTGSWLANSDARIKTGVRTVTGALDKLSQVRLVEFHYTDEYRAQHPSIKDRSYLNVVAQEFQKVFPEDVQSSGEKLLGGDAILQVDTYPLTIYSAAAIQELNQKLTEELKRRDAENAELKRSVEGLKTLVNALAQKLNGEQR
jgi:hypothetical protein